MTNKALGENPEQALPRNKKVFDIVRPGKTLALANSRSVAGSMKPPVADDQFVEKSVRTQQQPSSAPAIVKEHKVRPHTSSTTAYDLHSRQPLLTPRERVSIKPPAPTASVNDTTPSAPPLQEEASTPKKVVVQPPRGGSIAVSSQDDTEHIAVGAPIPQPFAPSEDEATEEILPSAPALTNSPRPQLVNSIPMAKRAPAAESSTPAFLESADNYDDPQPQITPEDKIDPLLVPPTDDAIPSIMSQDELMSQTHAPSVDERRTYVSHHRRHMHWWGWLLIFLAIVALALITFNVLLDADLVKTNLDIPHTNFL